MRSQRQLRHVLDAISCAGRGQVRRQEVAPHTDGGGVHGTDHSHLG